MTATMFLSDSAVMLRRNLVHAMRYPSVTLIVAVIPIIMYLLFVYVFGSTLGDGLGGAAGVAAGGRDAYIAYVTPGIILFGVIGGAQSTAIAVSMDMTSGIISRFRTMSIPRGAVLAGHVIGAVLQTLVMLLAVLAVALLTGFRPTTGPLEWLAAVGILALAAFAFSWLATALGLAAGSVESASNMPMPLILLPFFGSGFVPTDSMPDVLRWFSEYQPFTPINETLRGLLVGTEIGWSGPLAIGWCLLLAIGSYLWALRLYNRDPIR